MPVPTGPVPTGPVPTGPVPTGPVPAEPLPASAVPAGAVPAQPRAALAIRSHQLQPRAGRGAPRSADGLLLVGHGSRCAQGEIEMQAIGDLVGGGLPGVATEVGFLEMTDPPAAHSLDALVARGARRIVVLPLVLFAAGHAKSDIPAIVAEARARHRGTDIRFGSPLGVARVLVEMLGDAVVEAGGARLPLLVVGRGTSDPDANGDAHKASRLVAEWTRASFAHTGFSGVTAPLVPDALDVFARLGHHRMTVAFWFLCHGKLIERARDDIAGFSARTGVEVIDAGYFGPDTRLVALIAERYRQAVGGSPVVNCDTCVYRAPWPGSEDRVAQAVGVGHSRLAADHRHH